MRVKRGVNAKKKKRKVLKQAKNFTGAINRRYSLAKQQILKSAKYAYDGRKNKKGDFRRLWITRINAAARQEGLRYNEFIHGLKLANVNVNRKLLSEMAINDIDSFNEYVAIAKEAINNN